MGITQANWANQTLWTHDNLSIMRGMNSASVDLIYLDPPFNSKANYAAPIGSKAAGAEFKDTWTLSDIDNAWVDLLENKHPRLYRVIMASMTDSDKSYLIYMAVRLLEMHRILTDTGSIYLHCDPTMSHYLKLLMDAIFGHKHFQNEIVWCYREAINAKTRWNRKHDCILFYSKSDAWCFNADAVLDPHAQSTIAKYRLSDEKGRYQLMGRGLSDSPIKSARDVAPEWEETHPELTYRQYLREGSYPVDYWNIDIINQNSKERIGYPTQKPLALLERIIQASSNPGAVVFDPFCGCATTLVAAEKLSRQWVGIDISPKAAELVTLRLKKELGLFGTVNNRTDIPKRTDLGKIPTANSKENKTLLYGEQEGYCNGCHQHFELRHFEVDHIIAKKAGGTDHIDNLQLLCGNCNRVKGARGQEYLKAKLDAMLGRQRIFTPPPPPPSPS